MNPTNIEKRKAAAKAAYKVKLEELEREVVRLQKGLADMRAELIPNFGDVGSAAHYLDLLKQITDSMHGTGEFAE